MFILLGLAVLFGPPLASAGVKPPASTSRTYCETELASVAKHFADARSIDHIQQFEHRLDAIDEAIPAKIVAGLRERAFDEFVGTGGARPLKSGLVYLRRRYVELPILRSVEAAEVEAFARARDGQEYLLAVVAATMQPIYRWAEHDYGRTLAVEPLGLHFGVTNQTVYKSVVRRFASATFDKGWRVVSIGIDVRREDARDFVWDTSTLERVEVGTETLSRIPIYQGFY